MAILRSPIFSDVFSAHLTICLGGACRIHRLRSLSKLSNDFSSETTAPIATKFHPLPPEVGGTKSCSNGLGHMTNITVMSICSKTLKIFSRTNLRMILKLGMRHWGHEYNQDCSTYELNHIYDKVKFAF